MEAAWAGSVGSGCVSEVACKGVVGASDESTATAVCNVAFVYAVSVGRVCGEVAVNSVYDGEEDGGVFGLLVSACSL